MPAHQKVGAIVLMASASLGVSLFSGQEIRWIEAKGSQVQDLRHLVRPPERLGNQVQALVHAQLKDIRPVRPRQR